MNTESTTISHGQYLHAKGTPSYVLHKVITSAGKDAEYRRPGMHSGPPCTVRPASMLTASRDGAIIEAPHEVANGDILTIEGIQYRVEWLRGAELCTGGLMLCPVEEA